MSEIFSLSAIPKLLKMLADIKGDRKKELAKIGSVFGPTSDLCAHYVEPDAQLLNPADESDAPQAIRNFRKPAFKVIEDFLQPKKREDDGRNQMMILGDAGMGKTSLLIMVKLQHLMEFLPSGYGCVLLKINSKTLESLKGHPDPASTLLLLDALDEDPSGFGRVEERLLELLVNTRAFYRVLITCRTQFFPKGDRSPFDSIGQIRIGGFHCPAVFLSYFDHQQVEEYLSLRLKGDRLIAKARGMIRQSDSLQFRPMLLSFIDDLIDSNLPLKTRFDIYYVLINKWLLREQVKLLEQGRAISSDFLLDVCVDLANFMGINRSNEIDGDALLDFVDSREKMAVLSDLDIGGRSLLNRNSDGSFRFSHTSIQEFLFARAIATGRVTGAVGTIFVSDLELEFLTGNAVSQVDLRFIRFDTNLISDGYFQACDFSGMEIELSNFNDSQFIDCNFSDSVFRSCDFENVIFYKCYLEGSEFDRCSGVTQLRECHSLPIGSTGSLYCKVE